MKEHTLVRTSPAEQQVNAQGIINFLDYMNNTEEELHSYIILRHGKVISKGSWLPYAQKDTHMLFSLSKSFTSTAIGFAVHEGVLALDETILKYFPDYRQYASGDYVEDITIKDLLTMSCGHEKDATMKVIMGKDPDWIKGFFQEEFVYKPGTHFEYNSLATYILSAILQKVTETTLYEYLKPRLFDPLKVQSEWDKSPQGIDAGGWGLYLSVEEIAKFGQLYLDQGVYEGKQIIPKEWTKEATRCHIDNYNEKKTDWSQGYGYQFWQCRHNAFRGDGAFGQYCIVMPDQDMVIAMTGGHHDMQKVMDGVWQCILPAVDQVDQSEDSYNSLLEYEKSLKYSVEGSCDIEDEVKNIVRGTYILRDSKTPFKKIGIEEIDEGLCLSYEVGGVEHRIRASYNSWSNNAVNLKLLFNAPIDKHISCQAMCRWQEDQSLLVVLRFVNTPFRNIIGITFSDDGVEITSVMTPSDNEKPVTLIGDRQE